MGRSIAFDATGQLVVTGSFRGAITFGDHTLTALGNEDVFVAKLDGLTTQPIWSRSFGNTSQSLGTSVACDGKGNSFIVGSTKDALDFGGGPRCSKGFTQMYLAKLDPQGSHLFSNCFGDPSQGTGNAPVLSATPDGGVLMAGFAGSDVDFGLGPVAETEGSTFVARFDSDGQLLWSKTFGISDNAYPRGIAVDPSGQIYVTGWFTETFIVGPTQIAAGPNGDTFLLAIDSVGIPKWLRVLKSQAISNVFPGVAADPHGGAFVTTGQFYAIQSDAGFSASAGAVASFDTDGNLRWAGNLETPEMTGVAVASDANGNVAVLADAPPTNGPAENDIWLHGFDSQGNQLFAVDHGSGEGRALATFGQRLAVTGGADLAIDFGDGPQSGSNGGDLDLFVAILSPWLSGSH